MQEREATATPEGKISLFPSRPSRICQCNQMPDTKFLQDKVPTDHTGTSQVLQVAIPVAMIGLRNGEW